MKKYALEPVTFRSTGLNGPTPARIDRSFRWHFLHDELGTVFMHAQAMVAASTLQAATRAALNRRDRYSLERPAPKGVTGLGEFRVWALPAGWPMPTAHGRDCLLFLLQDVMDKGPENAASFRQAPAINRNRARMGGR